MPEEEAISRTALAGAIGAFIKDVQVRARQESVQNSLCPETAPPQSPSSTGPFAAPAFMMLRGSKYRVVNPMFGHPLSGDGGRLPFIQTEFVQFIAVPNSLSKDTTPPPPPAPPPNTPKRCLGNSLDSKDTNPPSPPSPPLNTLKRISSSAKLGKQMSHQSAQQLVEIGKAALAASSPLPIALIIHSGTSSRDREAPKPAPKPKPGPRGGGPKKARAELEFISTGTSHGHGHGHIAALDDSRANPFIKHQDKGTKFISTSQHHTHPQGKEILKSALKNSVAKGGKKGDMDGFIHTGPVTVPIYVDGGKDGKKTAHAHAQFCETASQLETMEGRESRRLGIKA